jgi:hypothetical protein
MASFESGAPIRAPMSPFQTIPDHHFPLEAVRSPLLRQVRIPPSPPVVFIGEIGYLAACLCTTEATNRLQERRSILPAQSIGFLSMQTKPTPQRPSRALTYAN